MPRWQRSSKPGRLALGKQASSIVDASMQRIVKSMDEATLKICGTRAVPPVEPGVGSNEESCRAGYEP
jgi:hypothetical protein